MGGVARIASSHPYVKLLTFQIWMWSFHPPTMLLLFDSMTVIVPAMQIMQSVSL